MWHSTINIFSTVIVSPVFIMLFNSSLVPSAIHLPPSIINIACGIVHKPKLVIMDEPTVAVDPQSRNKILEGIQELNKNGSTIIYTSHYMEEVDLPNVISLSCR